MARGDLEFFSPWLVSSSPNDKGEYRIRCPIHGDKNASATINFTKGLFHCNKPGCIGGCTTGKLRKLLHEREGGGEQAVYDPFITSDTTNVTDLRTRRALRTEQEKSGVRQLSEALVNNYHDNLMRSPALLEPFMSRRGLSRETIQAFKVGYESKSKRYTIPIRDEQGRVVNIRKYKLGSGDHQKVINHSVSKGDSYGSPPRLFPLAVLADATNVLVVEGELDALISNQHGFSAVTGTGGAGKWRAEWGPLFDDKIVTIIYDNDKEGRIGAHKAKSSLVRHAKTVRVLEGIVTEERGDISDYFLNGGTARALRKRIAGLDMIEPHEDTSGDVFGAAVEAVETTVSIIDSMDAQTNGKPLRMTATISGRKDPTRSIPAAYTATCTLDYGPSCKTCPMLLLHEGETTGAVSSTDVELISRFVERGADHRASIVMGTLGIPSRCSRFLLDVGDVFTVEELFLSSNVDTRQDEEADYTQRRFYNVGTDFSTQTNTVATVTGSTWPSPSTSRNEFFSWALEPAVTSIDKFEVTLGFIDRMQVFRAKGRQRPIDKCREIAQDMALNVTGIFGRERMHMAMDLAWHSPLRYVWRGKEYRGWLQVLVVGDTRTGKSETARSLARHYRLGHVISCEGATFAGLIGGAKQVGEQWTIQWGEYTLNDRRLAVMDEISGLTQEIISLMSDVRSSGEAQINKIETGKTFARVRSIWISNARINKYIDEKKTLGIDIIHDVIGNPEDIARFDIAMSVREEDVGPEIINASFVRGEPRYSSELCLELLLWAWSRKASDVVFTEDATKQVFANATTLSQMYVLKPGLLQMGDAHEKVSRLAAALAARVFSTDVTGTQVLVKREHVMDAAAFLHRLYSYDNFGYYRRSQREVRNREIAKDNRAKIIRWLKENSRVLEFLLDRTGSFRAGDMEEMAHMMKDEVHIALGVLSDAKMVSKEKSQIVLEPELQDLLTKEFKQQ